MGFPLHIRAMLGQGLLSSGLVREKVDKKTSADGQNWLYSVLVGPCSKAGSKESFLGVSVCLGAKSFPELHFGGGCADPEPLPPT